MVVLWIIASYVASQIAIACLPGYPWPVHTEPQMAVQQERFNREGGWLRENPTLEESILHWQLYHMLTAVEPQDIVFTGDSSCLMGIMPTEISELTRLRTWNLGTMGSLSIRGQTHILELFLNKFPHSKPQLVVCYVAPPTLCRTRDEIENLGVYNQFQEWLHGFDSDRVTHGWLSRLPVYRLRRPLLAAASDVVGDNEGEWRLDVKRDKFPSDQDVRSALLKTRGYLVEPRRNQLPISDNFADHRMPTADSIQELTAMFELTAAQSVDLLFVMSPAPEKYRSPETDAAYRRTEQSLREAAKPFQQVTIHAPITRYFPDQYFGSPNHLTEDGATRNSKEIADVLKSRLKRDVSKVATDVVHNPESNKREQIPVVRPSQAANWRAGKPALR